MSTRRDRARWASMRMEFDSELWVSYRASVDLFPALKDATRRTLTACAVYIGKQYQNIVPSRRVASSVVFRVAPPRMRVGPKDFRANFWESGTSPHFFAARGNRFKLRKSWRQGTNSLIKKKGGQGFQLQYGKHYMAIPVGGRVIFRTRVNHPGGITAGHYLRKAGETSMPVLEEIVARGFRDVFQ